MFKNILLKRLSATAIFYKSVILLFLVFNGSSLPANNNLPAQEIFLDGEWISFVQINGEVVYKPSTSFIFHQNKTWSMQKNNDTPVKQGEIKHEYQTMFIFM